MQADDSDEPNGPLRQRPFQEALEMDNFASASTAHMLAACEAFQKARVAPHQSFADEIESWTQRLELQASQLQTLAEYGAVFSSLNPATKSYFEESSNMVGRFDRLLNKNTRAKFDALLAGPDWADPEKPSGIGADDFHVCVGAIWALNLADELAAWFRYAEKPLKDKIDAALGVERGESELFDLICHGGAPGFNALVSWLKKPGLKRPASPPPPTPPPPTPHAVATAATPPGGKGPFPNWHKICPHQRFFRVTGPSEGGSGVLAGHGAFFTSGGRFNRIHQATLYVSPDPSAVIAELGLYQAQTWQAKIGGQPNLPKVVGPLDSLHRLWEIDATVQPGVVEIPSNEASLRFHSKVVDWEIFNPSHDYENLRTLADMIRLACVSAPHSGTKPAAVGIDYPSVRAPRSASYDPRCYAFFRAPWQGATLQANVVRVWELKLEFFDRAGQRLTSTNSSAVDWSKVHFQLDTPISGTVDPGLAATISAQANVPPFKPNPLTANGFIQRKNYVVGINHV